jgi:hypothetical protein
MAMNAATSPLPKSIKYMIHMMASEDSPLVCFQGRYWAPAAIGSPVKGAPFNTAAWHTNDRTVERGLALGLIVPIDLTDEEYHLYRNAYRLTYAGEQAVEATADWWEQVMVLDSSSAMNLFKTSRRRRS